MNIASSSTAGLLCLSAILFSSPPSPAQEQGSLDTRFTIVLSHSENPAGTVVALTTSSTYPCEGYRIRTHVTQSFDTLTVYIGGIVRPLPCMKSFSAAYGEAFFDATPGTFNFLRFVYRGENDLYRLDFKRNRLTFHPVQTSFTELTNR